MSAEISRRHLLNCAVVKDLVQCMNGERETDNDDDYPLSSLKLSKHRNANKTEVSEWSKNNEQFEVTDISIIERVRKI